MAYPFTPLPVVVEFWNGTTWVDITDYTYSRNGGGITITRGFQDEDTTPQPGSCSFEINNRDGRFTPKNPTGPYYGLIGRNTPVRVRLAQIAGERDDGTTETSQPAPSTSLDAEAGVLICVWGSAGAGTFNYTLPGGMTAGTEVDGTTSTSRGAYEVLSSRGATGTRTATANTAPSFWWGHSICAPDAAVEEVLEGYQTAGVDLTLTTGAGTEVGWTLVLVDVFGTGGTPTGTGWLQPSGNDRVWYRRVTSAGANAVTLSNASQGKHGHLYVLSGVTELASTFAPSELVRFVGEISEWPSRWDKSGRDVWVPVTAQGIQRRLNQGSKPTRSPLRSSHLAVTPTGVLVTYLPMEDPAGSTSFASALPSGLPMTYTGTAPEFAAVGPLLGSDAIPVLAATTSLSVNVPAYDLPLGGTAGWFSLSCILDVPTVTGWTDNTPIFWIDQSTGGSTVARWELRYKSGAGGDVQVRALDSSGAELAAGSTVDVNIDGSQLFLTWSLQEVNGDTVWYVYVRALEDDGTLGAEVSSNATFAGLVSTRPTRIQAAPTGGLTELGIGHIAVTTQIGFGGVGANDLSDALVSFNGETAADRADRLCSTQGISFALVGTASDTQAMGPQAMPSTLIDAYTETWKADQALAYETRNVLGLSWRTHVDLLNQTAALALDYSGAGEVAPNLEPTDDDQHVRNDVTIRRKGGSSARVVDSTSRLGTQDPPDGVGVYDTEDEINVGPDDVLVHHAGWRVRVGTWDESRYPAVPIKMAALAKNGKTTLMADVAALDVGDRITITNPPSWLPPDTIDLQARGFVEEFIHPIGWDITIVCVPHGPYRVQQLTETPPDDDVLDGWLVPDRFALRAAVDDNDTSWTVDIWPRMTTDADDMPCRITIGGEEAAITAVATTAATYVAAGAADHDDNAAVTPGDYAGGAVGDWVVVHAGERDTGAATLAISDANYSTWYELAQQGGEYVWAAVRTSDAPAPTVTPTSGAAGDTISAHVFGLRNMPITGDLSDWVIASIGQTNASAQNIAYGHLPASGYAGRVVLLLARKSDDWTSVAVPGGFTEITETSSTSGDDQGLYAAYRIDTTPTEVAGGGALVVTGGAAAVSDSLILALQGGYQTMTVTRAVNEVEKSHAAAAEIELLDPLVLSL